jgi:hypothetical protein
MDTNLVFPAPWVTDPPPPLDRLLVDLLDNNDLAEVSVTNPLTAKNIPDSEDARLAVHSLNCIWQALCMPFNTPDHCLDREDWMKYVFELLAGVHGGIRACQLASPEDSGKVADTFYKLTTIETTIASHTWQIIKDLASFFWTNHKDAEDIVKYHCFRCVQTAGIKPKSNTSLLKSIQLNTALDQRKLRESLLNEAVRETHKEVDEWREKQCNLLITYITELITLDEKVTAKELADSTHALAPDFVSWAAKYREEMWTYVCNSIAHTTTEDLVDPYGWEVLDEAISHCVQACEAEAEASFDRPTVFAARLAELMAELDRDMAKSCTSMVMAGTALLNKEREAITAKHECELLTLHNSLKLQWAEEKDRSDSTIAASVVRHSSCLSTRVPKTPIALNNKKKVRIGTKQKVSALDLNTPTPEPEEGSEYEYAKSTASEASLTADKSPMAEDEVIAPSPVNRNEHMPTLGRWFTTPEPPAPIAQPESTTPKPTTTDPILLALQTLTSAVGDLKSGIASIAQHVDNIESGKACPWGRDTLEYSEQDVPTAEDYTAKEYHDNLDFPMYQDGDNNNDYLKKLIERQSKDDTIYDQLHRVFRTMVDRGLVDPFLASLAISNSDFVEVAQPLFKWMNWDMHVWLADEQMTTLAGSWNRYIAWANVPIGALDIDSIVIPNSFTYIAPQAAPHPDWEAGWASAAKTSYTPTNKATEWSTPITYTKRAWGNKGKGKAAPSASPPTSQTIGPSPQTTPLPHPQSLLNKKKPGLCPLPQALLMTEYIAILDHTALTPPIQHPQDITQYVCQAQWELAEVQADVTLLASCWSSPHSGQRNFIFIFEGKVDVNKISKYDRILFFFFFFLNFNVLIQKLLMDMCTNTKY